MSTAMTRMDQDTKTLYVAFELGEKEWKLAMSTDLEARPRLRSSSHLTVKPLWQAAQTMRLCNRCPC